MKKILLYTTFLLSICSHVIAVELSKALSEAFKNNPELNAERENLKVSQEDLKVSKSEFLPSITITGTKSEEDTDKLTDRSGNNSAIDDVNTKKQTVTVEQKIFQGFGGVADLQKNEIGIELAKIKLINKEQEVLFKAIEGFTGVLLADQKFSINEQNLNLLERQVETDRARLEKGQISIADLAQSESSLAGAEAKFIGAKNDVVTAKLIYEKVIGPLAVDAKLNKVIDIIPNIPESLNKALQISNSKSPELIVAKLEYEQSKKDIVIARSELSPSASISLESSKTDDLSSTYDEQDKDTMTAKVTLPLFKGGKNYANLSRSKNLNKRKRLLYDNAIKNKDSNVASAWSKLQSSKRFLDSVRLQVKAAEIANEGITIEYETGLGRTTLDLIQSNTLLLDAKISLADAERDYLLTQFKFLRVIGLLTSNHLKLQ
tara:strand:- start:12839 stop:14137 length:1299 start_codon:yes stop_codon:yes gene_type:complete